MLKRIVHSLLSAIILLSSTGMVVQMHYCMDELQSVSLFVKPDHCHPVAENTCPFHAKQDKKKSCCSEESGFAKLQIEQMPIALDGVLELDWLMLGVLLEDSLVQDQSERSQPHYLNYKPPLLACDIPVAVQRFLI